MHYVQSHFLRLTPRDEYEWEKPPVFDYMRTYGTIMVTFIITLSYAVVAPLIVIFALVFYFVAYAVMKYQLFYVTIQVYGY